MSVDGVGCPVGEQIEVHAGVAVAVGKVWPVGPPTQPVGPCSHQTRPSPSTVDKGLSWAMRYAPESLIQKLSFCSNTSMRSSWSAGVNPSVSFM